jgi:hypothetical protein
MVVVMMTVRMGLIIMKVQSQTNLEISISAEHFGAVVD